MLLVFAAYDMFQVAWGTGHQLGEFAFTWAFLFLGFALFCLFLLGVLWIGLWKPALFQDRIALRLVALRRSLGRVRWHLIALILIFPILWIQFTFWGVVFTGIAFRLFLFTLMAASVAFLLSSDLSFIRWQALLAAAILCASMVMIAVPFTNVTAYPFSLGWSEGNRLWDYSMLFGRDLYIFTDGGRDRAYLDLGRSFLGGLPFLLPNVTILGERLWISLIATLPYFLLGLAAFYRPSQSASGEKLAWLLAGLWTLTFLRQGPIHAPLLVAAILVALGWRKPIWISIPTIIFASFVAAISRITWIFAPAIWSAMMVLASAGQDAQPAPSRREWRDAILLGVFGALTGVLVLAAFSNNPSPDLVSQAAGAVNRQPLLWYRLLPNSTYPFGIIPGLAIATLPLFLVFSHLSSRTLPRDAIWQKLAILLSLLAFLAVGLTASTKIGGGADLHNMDMFLIGLVFVASLVWERNGHTWMSEAGLNFSMRLTLLALFLIPGLLTLINMQPLVTAGNLDTLKVLTGLEDDPRNDPRMFGLLPSADVTAEALDEVRREVASASKQGEVLFMDHRQLLTFGYITNVPLVVDYEKKYLMDLAMRGNAPLFLASFHRDLAAHRFVLIVSDVLRMAVKDSDYSFGEENNAWVDGVVNPILCYYEPKVTLEEVRVQLLVPRRTPVECNLP